MEILAVIPARMGSTRLPGKPLLSQTGKPLIQHVVEQVRTAHLPTRIVVATDDYRIVEAVQSFGGEAVLTRADHPSGTDRVAEVARLFPSADVVVNIQGDEPELPGEIIDHAVNVVLKDSNAPMATLATAIRDRAAFENPACVKAVISQQGRALYFSRSPVPHHRDGTPSHGILGYLHLGLYVFRRNFLLELTQLPPSSLENTEKLEQLRVLEAGFPIAIGLVDEPSIGIDTPEDYRLFVERWQRRAGS